MTTGTEIPYWFGGAEPFFSTFISDAPVRALQIGVFSGDATRWLLDNRDVERIDDVDTWDGGPDHADMDIDFSKVERIYDARMVSESRVVKHKTTSDLFFVSNDLTFNFIYIDGDHTAPQTALDGLNAWRSLEVGGILAFDDYHWGASWMDRIDMPKDGIDAVLHAVQDRYSILMKGYQVWIRKDR